MAASTAIITNATAADARILFNQPILGSVTSARPTTARVTTVRGQLLAVTIARQDNCARRVLLGRQLLAVNSAVNSAVIVSATY